ncbi:MAG: arylsulfatase [Cereibacter sphaeroides]|uniref:Arylsulfatase n=1 Tax=Cereibacter sphaeroides TaxID=1063 RepID=A0A2W5TLT1_CERSP|nr:MAG: arylsulfatase [Cereibacter sphaeroides]
MRSCLSATRTFALIAAAAFGAPAMAQDQSQPNIIVIWGDDIGQFNISAYNNGMMGYRTPNIDSIAKDGALFTDWYGQQSCTAGRAAFITGQSPIRTGMTKVGLPGAPEGMPAEDATIATLLKEQGYVTGQFGKNHLGDRNEHLPTVHGFDTFFGNLYHLNAEEEPENPDYPADPAFKAKFGPRGVLDCVATEADTESPDPRFGAWGKQKCVDTGPLTRKRMETIDEEVTAKTLDFMDKAKASGKPMFVWYNTTRMHVFTHLKPESKGKTGLGVYADGMVEHDGMVGEILAKIKELGIEDNTIVMYSTDNGAETFTWPDGGTTMFRGEKNTNWEGGYRVPAMIRWPGVIKPDTVINDIGTHEDMLPTLVAAAGDPNVKAELLAGKTIGDRTYKSHIDGNDLGPALRGEGEWPTKSFIYWTDDGSVAALRYGPWKITFLEQPGEGLRVWQMPFTVLRAPLLTNLLMDPFERAEQENAMGYQQWYMERMFAFAPAGAYVAQWLQSFKEFPPRQKPGSFNLENVMTSVMSTSGQ